MALLDEIDQEKQKLKDAGYAEQLKDKPMCYHKLEEIAYKIFNRADKEDRAGRANIRVAQEFLTAWTLFECVEVVAPEEFEADEQLDRLKKYAKFKSAYIAKCIKGGETPIPGPMDENGNPIADGPTSDFSSEPSQVPSQAPSGGIPSIDSIESFDPYASNTSLQPVMPAPAQVPSTAPVNYPAQAPSSASGGYPSMAAPSPAAVPPPASVPAMQIPSNPPATASFSGSFTPKASISIDDTDQANKFCKYAMSALQYSDISTAVSNLEKALKLLTN